MTMYVANPSALLLGASNTPGKTVVQLSAGSRPLRIKEIGASFNGTDASLTPITVELCRYSGAGTATAGTTLEQTEIGAASLATYNHTYTSEPSATEIIRRWYVTPAGGLFVMQFPLGEEPVVGPSGFIGLRCITGSGTTPYVSAYIVFDE